MKIQRKQFIGVDHFDEWLAANEFDNLQVFSYGTTIQAIYSLLAPATTLPDIPAPGAQKLSIADIEAHVNAGREVELNSDGTVNVTPVLEEGVEEVGSGSERWGADDWTQASDGLSYPGSDRVPIAVPNPEPTPEQEPHNAEHRPTPADSAAA